MTRSAKIACIVNPRSANGQTGKRWPAIEKAVRAELGEPRAYMTERPNHATELARRAVDDGAQLVLSVGGDGTNNEVLNGLFEGGKARNPEVAMAAIPGGTGGDFARFLKIPKDPVEAARHYAQAKPRLIDIGSLTCIGHDGREISHMFLNIASFGIGGEVDARVNRTTKAFGGFASFLWGAMATMLTYKNHPIHVQVDDVLDETRVMQNVVVANGQYFGGGMWVAPEAVLDDGLFDILIMGDVGRAEAMLRSGDIYKGKHIHHPKMKMLRGRRVVATAEETTLIDMDGEQPGRLPITLEIVPRALAFLGA